MSKKAIVVTTVELPIAVLVERLEVLARKLNMDDATTCRQAAVVINTISKVEK